MKLEPTATGAKFWRASIFWKIAALMIVSSAILSVTISTLSTFVTRSVALDNLHELAINTTSDFADSSGRAIRFGDIAAVEGLANGLRHLAGNRISEIVVLDASGHLIHSVGNDPALSEQLTGFSSTAQELATKPLDGSRFMKAVPVVMGEENTRVGSVGVVWTSEPVLRAVAEKTLLIQAGAFLLFCVLLAACAVGIRRLITQRLSQIGTVLGRISDGDYALQVDGVDWKDELGDFARNIENLRQRLESGHQIQLTREAEQAEQERVVSELRAGLKALSSSDLTRRITAAFAPEYEPLRQDYNNGLLRLRDIVAAVKENSVAVRSGAEEISASSDDLAKRTEVQAVTLQQTSATLTELTQTVSEAAAKAKEVESIVLETQRRTDQNDIVVRDAVKAMSQIEQSSTKISNIILVIDDIAFQTNLLALNAGVEAARAGEAGRGFAVVATEVRSLAQRSAEAANEIKTLITASTEQVKSGVTLVRTAGEALSTISGQISHISSLVTEIAASAAEQAKGISGVDAGVTEIDLVTQRNAAMVEETSAAGQLLKQQSTALAEIISQFRIEADAKHTNRTSADLTRSAAA